MKLPKLLIRPWFLTPAVILLVVTAYVLMKKSPYERFLDVKKGDEIAAVIDHLGQPIDRHQILSGTDYLFSLTGHPDYPSLLGTRFPVHRIIRVVDGRVVSAGPYEDYYDPYSPGWTEKKKPNQRLEPTTTAVTSAADTAAAPAVGVAHH